MQVVSPQPNLPVKVNLVPFKETSSLDSPIIIYSLPGGGFHNIKRVEHSGRGLKKCGYEKPCILQAGTSYQFCTVAHGNSIELGTLRPETYGPDRSWVVCREEHFKDQDFIDVTLNSSSGPEFSGSISLYHALNVEAA